MKNEAPLLVIPSKEGEIKVYGNYSTLDPKGLIPHPDNNNIHTPEQIEVMKDVLKSNGFRVPVIVSEESQRIISGHLRVQAAISLGMEQVPVSLQAFKSRIEEVRHLTADNEVARLAKFDPPKFKDFQKDIKKELKNNDFQMTFFNPHEWGMKKFPKEKAQGTKKEPIIIIKDEQVWDLGPHKLEIGKLATPNIANHIQKFLKGWRKVSGGAAVLEETRQTFEELMDQENEKAQEKASQKEKGLVVKKNKQK